MSRHLRVSQLRVVVQAVSTRRSVRIALVMLPLLMLVMTAVTSLPAQSTADDAPTQPTDLQRLAQATGRNPRDLELLDHSTITLLDGQPLTQVKALDRATHEIVEVTLAGDEVVDAFQARQAADLQWRRVHGGLTPEFVQHLAGMRPT